MTLDQLLERPTEWIASEGPHGKIVLSSRVRLARNLRGHPFPEWANRTRRQKVLDIVMPAVAELPAMKEHFAATMDSLSALDKQLLVERHLISRVLSARNHGSGVVINKEETISVMINEEDHLRMQAVRAGLQLQKVFRMIDKVDSELEEQLDYAFSPRFGYLTACPTNVGTGMRASAMLHLPGLVLSNQMGQVIQAVNKLGMAVRGLHGEGTEAQGNLFQISNQVTLGEKESELLERLDKVVLQIVEHEENARLTLLEKEPNRVYDQIGRAYGVLRYAHHLDSKEALNLLSLLRMGVDLELIPASGRAMVDELMMLSQPAHVKRAAGRNLGARERDVWRAELIRGRLRELAAPALDKQPAPPQSEEEAA
ncbi:MAG: protein arginine kinase [Verrucomicrobiae bacterium]|nr:protein arginine kinase [Verrucomicrobiae bacterium]MDW8344345.1 protein arginine kinase [Verrucomicrobiae bacterium]